MKALLTIVFLILFISTHAQKFENTIDVDESTFVSPKATLDEISWIAGYWKGEAFGGTIEELWTPPLGGSMSGYFKAVLNGKVSFYEIFAIIEQNETLILKLRHFDAQLKAWEGKDETVDFPLVKVEKDRVYFSGFTFEKIDKDHINLYVVIGDDKGNENEMKFEYTRGTGL